MDRYTDHDVIDLFAGPGGAGMGITALELRELGFEWDEAACKTREANGLETVQGDLSLLDPSDYFGVEGLWASPPCQGFSRAGLMKGLDDAKRILEHIQMCEDEGDWVDFANDGLEWNDHRSQLVLEPLRWALLAQPRWMVWEQVPFVQIIWDACKTTLEAFGYHVWTGKVGAEQYGVPQSRERAILIASLDGPVDRPAPTHSKYYPRDPKKLDEGVLPWVTMAQALGWGMNERPYITVAAGIKAGGQDTLMAGGSGARKVIFNAHDEGRWVEQPQDHPLRVQRSNYSHGSDGDTAEERGRGVRLMDEPSMALTGRPPQWMDIRDPDDDDPTVRRAVDRAGLVVSTGSNSSTVGPGEKRDAMGWRASSKPYERSVDLPAPTVDTKAVGAWAVHQPGGREVAIGRKVGTKESMISAGLNNTARATHRDPDEAPAPTITGKGTAYWVLRNNTSENAALRRLDQPAPTMYFGARLNSMHWELIPGGQGFKKGARKATYKEGTNRRGWPVDGIAPTIGFGHDAAGWQWVAVAVLEDSNAVEVYAWYDESPEEACDPLETVLRHSFGESAPGSWTDHRLQPGMRPAPVVDTKSRSWVWEQRAVDWVHDTVDGLPRIADQSGTVVDLTWPHQRPSTVLPTRGLAQHPGATANATNGSTKSRNDGIRVTVEEAGVLQSFPADYAWQGSRTKQFEQVGNAVPVRLASHAVLEAARPTRGTQWADTLREELLDASAVRQAQGRRQDQGPARSGLGGSARASSAGSRRAPHRPRQAEQRAVQPDAHDAPAARRAPQPEASVDEVVHLMWNIVHAGPDQEGQG